MGFKLDNSSRQNLSLSESPMGGGGSTRAKDKLRRGSEIRLSFNAFILNTIVFLFSRKGFTAFCSELQG